MSEATNVTWSQKQQARRGSEEADEHDAPNGVTFDLPPMASNSSSDDLIYPMPPTTNCNRRKRFRAVSASEAGEDGGVYFVLDSSSPSPNANNNNSVSPQNSSTQLLEFVPPNSYYRVGSSSKSAGRHPLHGPRVKSSRVRARSCSHCHQLVTPAFSTTPSNGSTCSSDVAANAVLRYVNEKDVDAITMRAFYKPHTLTALSLATSALLYVSLSRTEEDPAQNATQGLIFVGLYFLVIAMLTFPNGPFTRPHPIIWRLVFGMSVLYLMALVFVSFLTKHQANRVIWYFYPELENSTLSDKEYGVDCGIQFLTVKRFTDQIDNFCIGHLIGWVIKACLIRHYGISWLISVLWEWTEICWAHILLNFNECWWDSFVLDVLLCNGGGIYLGMKLCQFLEIREYRWESFSSIPSAGGKLKRAALQMTPVSWTHVRWYDPDSSYWRIYGITVLVVLFQIVELNTFFLNHIFKIDSGHHLCLGRLCLILTMTGPVLRQYYFYISDKRCRRMGAQLWVFFAITAVESVVCIKFREDYFEPDPVLLIVWFIVLVAVSSLASLFFFFLNRNDSLEHHHLSEPISSQTTPSKEES